jgi:hypothetical protein
MDGPDEIPRQKASRMLTRSERDAFEHDVLSMSQILRNMADILRKTVSINDMYHPDKVDDTKANVLKSMDSIKNLEYRIWWLDRGIVHTPVEGEHTFETGIGEQKASSLVIEAIACTNILKNLFTKQPQDIEETFNTVVANFQRLKGELQIEPITPHIEEIVSVVMRTLF